MAASLGRLAEPRRALTPIELIEHVRIIAADVAAGRYPFIAYDAEDRWHQRIYRDARMDVWLISWLPTQGTQLHDHGGSSGAFTVVSGELSEAIYQPGSPEARLREQVRGEGASVGFGPHYVHDVRNLGDEPAVSVHAYSAPLTRMNYYDVASSGELVRLAHLDTDDPEASPPVLDTGHSAAATRWGVSA